MVLADLQAIMPYSAGRAALFVDALNATMAEFGITSPRRQAAFLSQVAHESGELRYTAEIADGTNYEGRADLGNTAPGDGVKYKGRGLIQVTGKANYLKFQAATGMPVVASPTLLETPEAASRSAGWFWQTHSCNALADGDKFGSVTHVINGGYNGLDFRIAYWLRARAQLKVS